jgi:phage-related tail protein
MSEVETIEQLRERYDRLNHRKTEAQTLLKSAEVELDRIRADAREKFGTDDLESLKKKLAELEAENLRRREAYQKQLDSIDVALKEVDKKYEEI